MAQLDPLGDVLAEAGIQIPSIDELRKISDEVYRERIAKLFSEHQGRIAEALDRCRAAAKEGKFTCFFKVPDPDLVEPLVALLNKERFTVYRMDDGQNGREYLRIAWSR